MKLLGSIKEVNDFDLAVSLPYGLSGFVHITDINDVLNEAVKVMLNEDEDQPQVS